MSDSGEWSYYAYKPSYGLAYMGIACFAVLFLVQAGLLARYRTYYMIPFLIGMLGETLGYAFRRVSSDHLTGRGKALGFYVCQELLLILSPAFMCASYYMCFGRLIQFVGETWTPIPSKWVTATFVTVDVVSIVVQGAGGSLFASDDPDTFSKAKPILLVGFIIQIIGLGLFSIFAGIYHLRARRAAVPPGGWTKCLYTLYAGCVCVLVRGIFRTIEFGTGTGGDEKGYLLSIEAWLYGLEFAPILLAGIILSLSYPGRYVPSRRQMRRSPKSATSETLPLSHSGSNPVKEAA
ncbi:RTA1 domain-containing protein [Rhodotorula paludigena]|uniref:RTA1 domain-containing protein n=1 Tax=Rhodotorula paludigena TaxID=86838 RepID=UPI00317110B0